MPLIVTGIRETISAMHKTVAGDTVKVAAGLNQCARELLTLSRFYVPKDTWALHDTGRVVGHSHGFAARYSVEYGGTPLLHEDLSGEHDQADVIVDYAAVVHNDLTARHDPPTQALYLSRASVELMPRFAQIMGRVMRSTGVEGVMGMNREGMVAGRVPRGMRS